MTIDTIPCRKGCDHKPFKSEKAERMHFHRIHARTIVPFRENRHKRNGHSSPPKIVPRPAPAPAPKQRIAVRTGEPDRRTKAWRDLHPRLAKPLGGLGKPRRDIVTRALEHFAEPALKLECPTCHYDFNLLANSLVPNKVCPGCGTSFQTLIARLTAFTHA